jgi:hypothetical protein
MKIEVPPDILDQTTRCQSGFCCLSEHGADLCQVEAFVDNRVQFVRCLSAKPYQMPFGQTRICTCPARLAIFARYTI